MKIAAIITALLFASPALAQCGEAGSCTEVHATPGCIVVECCQQVCKANPLCCELTWDAACVVLANDLCDGLTCPSPGSCFDVHFTPGCETIDCCWFNCTLDAFCCFVAWDSICVEGAARLCGVGQCAIAIPADAVDEAEHCYERLNDGCNVLDGIAIPLACGAVRTGKYSTGSPRDTDWYSFELTSATRCRAQLTSEFPG